MKKKLLASGIVAGSLAVAAVFGARAYAANSSCVLTSRGFPAGGVTDTVTNTCTHISVGRPTSNATFVAKNQGGVKTMSVSLGCCGGMSATIFGLDANDIALNNCSAKATFPNPASVTCNAAVRWRASFEYLE